MRSINGSMLPAWKTRADACFACVCSVSPCGGHVPVDVPISAYYMPAFSAHQVLLASVV